MKTQMEMEQIVETYFEKFSKSLPEKTRVVVSPQVFAEGRDLVQYAFVAYRGKTKHIGEYKGHSHVVDIDGYGILAVRVVSNKDNDHIVHLKIGETKRGDLWPYYSARNNEVYYVLNFLGSEKMKPRTFSDLTSFVLREVSKLKGYFDEAARKEVKDKLGFFNSSPFAEKPKLGKRGVDL